MIDLVHSPRITTQSHDVGPTGIGTQASSNPGTVIGVRINVVNGGDENSISGIHSADTHSDIGAVSIGEYCNTQWIKVITAHRVTIVSIEPPHPVSDSQ